MPLNFFLVKKVIATTTAKKILLFLVAGIFASVSFANPVLDQVTHGVVTVNQSAGSTQVVQSSQQAILEWKSFNIAAGEKTQFVQPNANAIALNRINPSQGVSQIYGSLTANGTIILINGAGIHFGSGSVINVGGLVATTSNISNANFLAGKYIFDQASPYNGSIINDGQIRAARYGLIALLGSNVVNNGLIRATLGTVLLATGDKFTLDFYGDQLINFSVDASSSQGGRIKNTGEIFANGGKILVSAQAAQGVLDNVIDMQGVLQANSVAQHNGEIILSANQGTVRVSGKLTAAGKHANHGGSIQILANNIDLTPTAQLNVDGITGGGNIVLSGNNGTADSIIMSKASLVSAQGFQSAAGGSIYLAGKTLNLAGIVNVSSQSGKGGKIKLQADNFTLDTYAYLNANGGLTGGDVDIWAQQNAELAGKISAASGYLKGAGGTINIAAENSVNIDGILDASALGASSSGGFVTVVGENTRVNGIVDVSATQQNSTGGKAQIEGQEVYLDDGTNINARGGSQGGQVEIGGTSHPQNTTPKASNVTTTKGSVINASAVFNGNGGTVDIWSQQNTELAGKISSDSGYNSGNAGTIQVYAGNTASISGSLEASSNNTNSMGGFVTVVGTQTQVNGNIDVSAKEANSRGGSVAIIGQEVSLDKNATINASGGAAGGQVNVGGNYQGQGRLLNALDTTVSQDAVINVSALLSGNAGQAVIWSQNKTTFAGKIFAQGGSTAGNGGLVEVSGHAALNYTGSVNTLASQGKTGTLLLDPGSVTIQDSATPNPNSSVITVANLQSQLATSNVLVQTGNTGNQVGDITVANNVTWSNANTLTLSAFRNINVNATIANNSGGSLIINTDNTRTGTGTIVFGQNGAVNFSGGGQVVLYYNTNNIANPNFYYGNINVSRGTTFTQDPLNALTTSQNNAIISSIVQMTSYLPFTSVASTVVTSEPTDTDAIGESAQTVTTMDNDLEKVVEEDKPLQFELAATTTDATQAAKPADTSCNGKAACFTNDFIIK